MTLHLIQKSPFSTSLLDDCLNVINVDDSIILMQDGVLACQQPKLATIKNTIFVLQDDLDARGIQLTHKNVNAISYTRFVQLCTECKNTISWY